MTKLAARTAVALALLLATLGLPGPALAACATDFAAASSQAHNGLYEMMENVCNALQNLTITGGGGGGGGIASPFKPAGAAPTIVSATTTSSEAVLNTSSDDVRVDNWTASGAWVNLGTTSGVTAGQGVAGSIYMGPLSSRDIPQGSNGYIAVQLLSGTGTVTAVEGVTDEDATLTAIDNLSLSGGSFPADSAVSGTVNAATANAAYTVTLGSGEGVTAFTVSGLTAAGATLTLEGSNDGGTTWTPINELYNAAGAPTSTLTADGQFRISTAGRRQVRLRVSATGTGTITIAANKSTNSGLVAITSPIFSGNYGYVGADCWDAGIGCKSDAAATGYPLGSGQAFGGIALWKGMYNELDLIRQGQANASSVTQGTTPWEDGGLATSSSPSACTSGQSCPFRTDVNGRIISWPLSNKENALGGAITVTSTTTPQQLLAAPGLGQAIFVSDISCSNGGPTGTVVEVQNGSGGSDIYIWYLAPSGGGFVKSFVTPKELTTNTGLYIKTDTSDASVYCNGGGVKGAP